MSQIVIDIAWSRPTVAEIKATGAVGVIRYGSTDPTKNLTAAEVAEYHAAGLGTAMVWETTSGRALQGYQAGVDDASLALAQRQADGLPSDEPVYAADDTDSDWASVADYYRGFHDVIGNDSGGVPLTGPYGGFRVMEGAYADGYRHLWQTLAWSGGQVSAHAVLYQDGRTALSGNADVNEVLAADWGQYPRPTPTEDIVTPQDKQDIIDGVLRGIQGGPTRDAIAFAELWWLDHALGGTTTPAMTPGQAGLIQDIHRLITELNATTPPPKAPAAAALVVQPVPAPAKP